MSDIAPLLADLARLPQVSPEILSEIELMTPQMLAHLDAMLTHHPELAALPMPRGPLDCRRTLRQIASGFLAALHSGHGVRLIAWAGHTLATQRAMGFLPEHWRIEIECTLSLIDQNLSPEAAAALRPLLVWILRHLGALEEAAACEAA